MCVWVPWCGRLNLNRRLTSWRCGAFPDYRHPLPHSPRGYDTVNHVWISLSELLCHFRRRSAKYQHSAVNGFCECASEDQVSSLVGPADVFQMQTTILRPSGDIVINDIIEKKVVHEGFVRSLFVCLLGCEKTDLNYRFPRVVRAIRAQTCRRETQADPSSNFSRVTYNHRQQLAVDCSLNQTDLRFRQAQRRKAELHPFFMALKYSRLATYAALVCPAIIPVVGRSR